MIACLDGGPGAGRGPRGAGGRDGEGGVLGAGAAGGQASREASREASGEGGGDPARKRADDGPASEEAGPSRPSPRGVSGDHWKPPAWSARFLFHPEAPHPSACLGALDDRRIGKLLEGKRSARDRAIAQLQSELRSRGMPDERILAAIMYDGERAPKSTNRAQLAALGIDPPRAPSAVDALDPADCMRELWRTIYGLASLGIFLLGTDHLDDRRLLAFLATRVLEEEILDIPPIDEMSEFIDLGTVSPTDEVFTTLLARPEAILVVPEATSMPIDGETLDPALPGSTGSFDPTMRFPRVIRRDALLPRPDRRGADHHAPPTGGAA